MNCSYMPSPKRLPQKMQKKILCVCPPAPSEPSTLVLHGPSLFFVASLASLLHYVFLSVL